MLGELLWLLIGGSFIGGKAIKEQRQISRSRRNPYWYTGKKFDHERQDYYTSMYFHDKKKMEELLGAPLTMYSVNNPRPAVAELLKREGLDYYDARTECQAWAMASGYRKDKNGDWRKPWWKI